MRRLLGVATAAAAVTLAVTGCGGGSSTPTDTASPTASAPATPVMSSVAPTATTPRDPRGYTDADIVKTVVVDKPNAYGSFEYSDNSPDFNPNASNGVGFKYWGCRKQPGEVFNNVVIRIEVGVNGDNGYLDGHDQMDRNPVEMTTATGQGFIHVWGSAPEGLPHYPVTVTSDGQCNFQLDFVSIGSGTAPNLGRQVLVQTGTGNDNVDTPDLTAPWRLAWQYTCPSSGQFIVADSAMGGGHIVQTYGTGNNGVFEQGVDPGSRTLSVVTGPNCQWRLLVFVN